MKTKRKRKLLNNLAAFGLVLPAFMVVILVVAYPILNSILRSFHNFKTNAFTFEHYTYFFTNRLERGSLIFTLQIVVITVVLAIALSYLLAMYLRFSKTKTSKIIGVLYLRPRFHPGLVAIYGMIAIIRDTGFLNRVSQIFGADLKPGFMFNPKGIVLMNIWFNIPFATLIITSGLSGIPDSIIEGARDVGAGKWKVFTHMILPLSVKDVFIASTFVFMGNVGSFTTPFLMLGATNPTMLGILLYRQFNSYMDYEKTAALSVIMFLICSISAGVYIYTNLKEKDWQK
jgi:ABC-type spermidine/putrescine transport system permease subunit I